MLLDQVGAAASDYALPAVDLAEGSERFSAGAEHAHEAGYVTSHKITSHRVQVQHRLIAVVQVDFLTHSFWLKRKALHTQGHAETDLD